VYFQTYYIIAKKLEVRSKIISDRVIEVNKEDDFVPSSSSLISIRVLVYETRRCVIYKLFWYCRGAYLYRRERKKRHRKLSEKISESLEQKKLRRRGGGDRSSEDGSSGGCHSQRDGDDSDGEEMTSSEAESSGEADEERVPLELSDTLKRLLEEDHDLITKKNKVSSCDLVTLTTNVNVVFLW
jgi:hypothetical protein